MPRRGLALYPDGRAAACSAYAAPDAKRQCFCLLPEDVCAAISNFLSGNGTPPSPGDGSISASTFQH